MNPGVHPSPIRDGGQSAILGYPTGVTKAAPAISAAAQGAAIHGYAEILTTAVGS